jgi:hypothetical protein
MKMNDEYFIWAVLIAVVVFALMYSWNSREHFVKQKCWGAEQVMSATTGYIDGTKYMQGFWIYLRYLGEKLTSQGKCSSSKDAFDCVNRNVSDLNAVATLDTAKTFCATANCVGIFLQQTANSGTSALYIPVTSELTKEVPKGPDGKELSAERIATLKIILPVACPSSSTDTSYTGNKAVEEAQAKYKAEGDKRAKDLLEAADWLAKNKTLSPADFTKAWEKKYGGIDSTVTEAEWLKALGDTGKGSIDSQNRAIDAVGAPTKDATSTLGSVSGMSGMNGKWQQGPKGSVGDSDNWATPGDSYILKSSLVPCTCTKHSMGCERHSGSKQESFAPGDLDGNFQYRTQPQSGLMRPFSQAFLNQGEPTGFLNSFGAFGW